MKTLQQMLQTPEVQKIVPSKQTLSFKKEELAKLVERMYGILELDEKLAHIEVSTGIHCNPQDLRVNGIDPKMDAWELEEMLEQAELKKKPYIQQQEVDYLAAKTGEEMPIDDQGYTTSLLHTEQYISEEEQSTKKAVNPVQTKEKTDMKKEAIIVEVNSKEEFVNAVQEAMKEGRTETSNNVPSTVICRIDEKNYKIMMEFNVAIKDGQPIIVKFHLPQNITLANFVKDFAGSMLAKSKLLKRNIFTLHISPRIYEMLRKQIFASVKNAAQRENMGKSNMLAVINVSEKGAVLQHKDKNTVTKDSIHLAINKA